MTEQEIEELLGAYALDAVDADERTEVELHLVQCPRCRAEVAAHREVAAMFANSGTSAPDGLWDRIAGELSPDPPDLLHRPTRIHAELAMARKQRGRTRVVVGAAILGAAAMVLVIALLFVQVSSLNRQVHSSSGTGITAAVNSVLAHAHRTVELTSNEHRYVATVAFGSDGNAYWIGSNLPTLPRAKTYQLWTLADSNEVVSLGVLGSNPNAYTAFRVQPRMSRLMITVEPEGGTPTPTTPVLLSATI